MLPIMQVLLKGDTSRAGSTARSSSSGWASSSSTSRRTSWRVRSSVATRPAAPPRPPGCRRATAIDAVAGDGAVAATLDRAGRPVGRQCTSTSTTAGAVTLAPAAAAVVPAPSAATSPARMPDRPGLGDRRRLRRHRCAGGRRQRREVLPGILLRQGRDPRRQRHPPAALRPRAARPDEPLRLAGHQRRHQPARAGRAGAGGRLQDGARPEHPGADQGGVRVRAGAVRELEADAVHRGLRAADGA